MTVTISQLWLPIVVSSVAIFFASFLAWMVLPHHKKDIKVLPDESAWTSFLNKASLEPGTYMWPGCATPEEMKSEEYKARYANGPWGSVNILGAQPSFGRNLFLVFVFYLVLSTVVAYLAGQAREAGDAFNSVFVFASTAAVLGYCAGSLPGALFFGKPLRFVVTEFIDGAAYGLITGAVFAWLWPAASTATGVN